MQSIFNLTSISTPKEMELKVENQNTQTASHLDLDLEINDRIFNSNLYDKREAFSFSVVRMPHRQSNMPSKMFYSTISAEVIRSVGQLLIFLNL